MCLVPDVPDVPLDISTSEYDDMPYLRCGHCKKTQVVKEDHFTNVTNVNRVMNYIRELWPVGLIHITCIRDTVCTCNPCYLNDLHFLLRLCLPGVHF